ncbi:MAG: DUF5715 family protein [Paludibacteraceae bacterium]|nr:DUF5715 family protein [Paludibacteraceae bacterium]
MRWRVVIFLMAFVCSCNRSGQIERADMETVEISKSDSIANYDENDTKNPPKTIACEYFESIPATKKLQDKNTEHLLFAQNIGLKYGYMTDNAFFKERDSLLGSGSLLQISDNKYYKIKDMEHSFPYLTREAADLLEEIGMRFQYNLEKKHQKEYAVYVTSALRTYESQRKLFRRNKNATQSTTSHLFGTTFDISYMEFYRNTDDKIIRYKNIQDILTKTLQEMRLEKCCLVLKESKQQCFHITIIQ